MLKSESANILSFARKDETKTIIIILQSVAAILHNYKLFFRRGYSVTQLKGFEEKIYANKFSVEIIKYQLSSCDIVAFEITFL